MDEPGRLLEERVAKRIKAANVGEYMSDNAAALYARAAIDEVLAEAASPNAAAIEAALSASDFQINTTSGNG